MDHVEPLSNEKYRATRWEEERIDTSTGGNADIGIHSETDLLDLGWICKRCDESTLYEMNAAYCVF